MIQVQQVWLDLLHQRAQILRCFFEMLLTFGHPVEAKRRRDIMQVRQPLHPRRLLRKWNLAETHQRHAIAARNQPTRQLARVRPDSIHCVGRDQYVHNIAESLSLGACCGTECAIESPTLVAKSATRIGHPRLSFYL